MKRPLLITALLASLLLHSGAHAADEEGWYINIGAGTVTCNYDGETKKETHIGDDVFIGSDSMLIAPVRIGARSWTGAGAVVTKDVPSDSMAVGVPARISPKKTNRGSN